MNLLVLIVELLLSSILFLLMNYLSDNKLNRIDTIIIPNISMILLACIFTKLKDFMILFLIFYLVIDFIYVFLISKKSLLINNKNYYLNSIITLIIGIIIYQFFLLKVEYAYVDMEVFKNFIWVLIIFYFYNKLNIKSIKLDKLDNDNYLEYYKEFVVLNYARLKNKYNYLIKTNIDIENVLYSILIYETYKKNKNIIYLIKDRFNKKNNLFDNDKTIEENIVFLKDKLEAKYKRVKNNKLESIIKDNYKDINDYNEILKIMDIIKEFK
ncbi:MAG: hypothetical protein IJ068_01100 [Bacilli bacterium]|nr:hypothetical protein [Bacilli bacterium]